MDVEREIEAFLATPEKAPSADLAEFAQEHAWIGMRHLNWCRNWEGRVIEAARHRRVLHEIGFHILTGYLLMKKKQPNKAPEPTTTAVTSPAAQEPRQP